MQWYLEKRRLRYYFYRPILPCSCLLLCFLGIMRFYFGVWMCLLGTIICFYGIWACLHLPYAWFLTCFMSSVLRFHMRYWHSRLGFVLKLIWNLLWPTLVWAHGLIHEMRFVGVHLVPIICALFAVFPCSFL